VQRRAPHRRDELPHFGSPEKTEVMWQFSETVDGLAEADGPRHAHPGGTSAFYKKLLAIHLSHAGHRSSWHSRRRFFSRPQDCLREEGDGHRSARWFWRRPTLDRPRAGKPRPHRAAREFSSSNTPKRSPHRRRRTALHRPGAEKRLQDCLIALAAEGAVQSAHDISGPAA